MGLEELPLDDLPTGLDVRLHRGWLGSKESDLLQARLADEVPWTQHHVQLFGRRVPSPRLSCWIGDADASYAYSGTKHRPEAWPAVLVPMRSRLNECAGETFNSCLANRYRNGEDSMGWHSDDEPELGAQPTIASLSLGSPRSFRFRRRNDHRAQVRIELQHGDLLIMFGDCQAQWQHALPKMRSVAGERINLTFRRIRSG